MKKSVLLIISLIYVLAVVLVGTNLKLKVYDPIVYAEKIEVLNEEYEAYTDENRYKEYDGNITLDYKKNMVLELKCRVFPYDATNIGVTYIFDKQAAFVQTEVTQDNFLSIKFVNPGIFPVIVRAADGSGVELNVFIDADIDIF